MWWYQAGWGSREEVFVKAMKERLSNIGVEEVEIDNGWWGSNGEAKWEGDPHLWPHGMEAAGKACARGRFEIDALLPAPRQPKL